ncbi:MAG: bifunctional phosphoribosylaminoimidazolecarboxamide formyltransferase/IMP cyclohydrolase PurH [Dethiobacter sp.]|jgi:phosphoribosylaminoimidazolecarboxamide formyltransferase/IMP cyclohydrolase|nr:MAG: bifunctional phosphoribosylaminoimidazolecarboxamide formyltransferase/IMP cyclohydrolase PurH [Dethiobacter sp.]
MEVRKALISVSDKTGVVLFAQELEAMGWEIVSTGGTAKTLREAGVKVKDISRLTGFPEILEGRLKTLHPLVHGGILGRRDSSLHLQQMQEHGIETIDLVAVNLYPFPEVVAKGNVTLEEAIENIDIGGPTMVRSAAKNYRDVIIVVEPANYSIIVEELRTQGDLSLSRRYNLAVEAFTHTAYYDSIISNYLRGLREDETLFPSMFALPFVKVQDLRYGENPHQRASFYRDPLPEKSSVAAARQLQGKELSFNNINDLNAAWELLREFEDPTAVAVKHTNPCGVGSADSLLDACRKAHDADPVSIFGGIVTLNREVDRETALMMSKIFLEVVAAPSFSSEALEVFSRKKDVRLLEIPLDSRENQKTGLDFKKVSGGLLLQDDLKEVYNSGQWRNVTSRKPTEQETKDLIFALKVVKHVKSNAIVIAKRQQTLGIGAGQMSRVGSVKIAVNQAGENIKGSVMASDAFFPFKDGVELAAVEGVTAVIQPGGSNRDEEAIETCEKYHIAMLFTGKRYFKH